MKERWFNFRPLCLVFSFLLLGSVFSFYVLNKTIICFVFLVIVAVLLLTIAILKKRPIYFLIPLISFVLGISFYSLAIISFNNHISETPNLIQARICDISYETNGEIKVEADSVLFDTKKINDKIAVYIYDNNGLFDNIKVGTTIEFSPKGFYKTSLFQNEIPNSKIYSEDLKYTATVSIENINIVNYKTNLAEKFKDKVKTNLDYGLTNENVEIAYSALFGDKNFLSDKQYNTYKLSGVAHLLAVSGLHVGIIVAILSFICNKLNVKKWYKLGLISIFLLFYMYLCGYSISIVRASIMSVIAILAGIMKREYDPFNSISIAGIVIFLINPLCIFDVGFLLSFSCVIGITMLYMPIESFLNKTKISPTICKSLAMSLSTTIAIIFIMAYYFNTLNIISILANVIIIPIFTFAFTIIFVISMFSIAIPYCTYLLYPINYILEAINLIATMLGGLYISNFNTMSFNFVAILLYFVLLLFLGRFCTAKYQYKVLSVVPTIALLFYCLL